MERNTRSAPGGFSRAVTLLCLLTMMTSGCLGHLYEIPRSEMERLVRTPAQERGREVYAIQQFSTTSDPEPAIAWEPPPGSPPPGYLVTHQGHWVPSFYVDTYGLPYYEPPVYQRPPPTSTELPSGSVHGASPVPQGSSGGSKGSGGGSSGGGSLGNLQGIDKLLVLVVVVGVVVGVSLAATEGARYEGSVAVHPHHPVHLVDLRGKHRIVPLDELVPGDLQNLSEAMMSGEEGAGMWLNGSAPLNRKGFSYQFGVGNDSLALPGGQSHREAGFRFALGYYPGKTFGLLADTRLQFDSDAFSAFYNVRLGLEAQWYPIHLWRLHLGPFVGGGRAWSATEGGALPSTAASRPYVTFGGLAEFDLTTRLGLTFRWTQDWLPNSRPELNGFVHSWSLGLAVY
ncbi:hypothetical protein [Melittangium boletus]|uniref:Lipoprotein n=1 Tax=Melittangium boletus DSM 14713 TaxID=1294270 RepID=A0A286NV89_9BACT|nr:hypothetical protein [Melittangium boletus]ATB27016.1 hypothetical protein MEBOL_000451 [Melittangium boletus DSM 14713]